MTDRLLNWEPITDRAAARELQSFTCTSDFPRTSSGKKLPHPKKWEREVQSHFRETSKRLKQGELLLVGRSVDSSILAAAHLILDRTPSLLQVYIASIGVSVHVRGQGGVIADEALAVVCEVAREEARLNGLNTVIVTGKIHTRNLPSESLFVRTGFEPYSVPYGEYQLWLAQFTVE